MSKLAELKAQAELAAQTGPNMTEAQKGGGSGRLLPEGYAFGRLVEYIEFGKQPQEFQGQAKDPALEFQLGFALWGEGYQNEDGTPYMLRPYSIAMSRNEKAGAFKLFKLLNWKGDKTHFSQLIGDGFLVKIVHADKSKADKTKVSRIDLTGFLPPLDPVTKSPYPIPEPADDAYRLFLWDRPTKEAWNSLYVEGTWDDGKSKNRVQESILGAVDFEGSALQALLMQSGVAALPSAPEVPQANPTLPAVNAAPALTPASPAGATGIAVPASAPVLPALTPTFPSNPVPSMPSIPAMPAMPAMPVLPA